MKVIIAGSRDAEKTISYFGIGICMGRLSKRGYSMREIVSGAARGVDTFAIEIGDQYKIPVKTFPADWDTHGKQAGYLRNAEMAEYADALIAIWDGKSPGTKMMIDLAQKKGRPVEIYRLDIPAQVWGME